MPRLFLLDGMALVYRAHFAFIQNPIRNSKGVNTSALYGFTNTLLTILEAEQPSHLGVAFDTSAPTARHLKFPAYKAQRDEMPEELAAAIPAVKQLCRAFHIPVLELDGFEADDIIGTLATRAEAAGLQTFMVTPDKDFAQLVSPAISIWKPGRRGSDHEILDLPAILQQWEIQHPSQVVDILGLWGDSSDNIPGVPGIGEKTAKQLIARFGSIENLLAHTADLKGKQKETIEAHAVQALLCKDLAAIIRNVPVAVTWDDLALAPRDDDAIKSLFNEFEFRSLTKRLFSIANKRGPGGLGLRSPQGEVAPPGLSQDSTSSDSPASPNLPAPPPVPTFFETFRTIRDTPHVYHLADTPHKQRQLFAALAAQPRFCFDTETTSLDRFAAKLLGIAFCWQAGEAWYLPWSESLAPALREVLATPAEKIGHNLKFDLAILLNHGIEVSGPFCDTMLAHILVHPGQRHTMDYLAEALLGYSPVKLSDIAAPAASEAPAPPADLFDFAAARGTAKGKAKDLDIASIPLATLAEYAAEDADVTFQLAAILTPQLDASGQGRVFRDIECPLLPALVHMEQAGIAVDLDALAQVGVSLQQRIDELAATIQQHAGRSFNLNSPKQLGEILFDELKLADKAKKTATGQYKTDEQTLATLEGKHPVVSEILAYREAAKLKSTYVDSLPSFIAPTTGRIHTHFHQLVAATGRLASTDPNLQNIPVRSAAGREIRKAFVPRQAPIDNRQSTIPPFTLLSCDYSQIELRVMAALAGDESMIDAFRAGLDIHNATAAKVFGVPLDQVTGDQRRSAKMVNFGIIYGISAFGLSQRLAIPRPEAASIIDAYFREYPAIREFMERTIAQAREAGYVATLTGRRRSFPDLTSSSQVLRSNAERAAINTPIQGTAADMIKLAMIRIDALLRESPYQTRMLLQVHDELVFDLALPERDELVPKILHAMKTALPLPHDVPIEVEHGTGPNWLAAH